MTTTIGPPLTRTSSSNFGWSHMVEGSSRFAETSYTERQIAQPAIGAVFSTVLSSARNVSDGLRRVLFDACGLRRQSSGHVGSVGDLAFKDLGTKIMSQTFPESRKEGRELKVQALQERIIGFIGSPYIDTDDSRLRVAHAVCDSLVFLRVMELSGTDLPDASSYSDDGEVVLSWSLKGKGAEVAFLGHSEMEYTYLCNGRYLPGREQATPFQVPNDFKEYLAA